MVCGGFDWAQGLGYLPHEAKLCYKFIPNSNTAATHYEWTYSHNMTVDRFAFGYAKQFDTLWITGGETTAGRTASTEFVSISSAWPGPDLPGPR